MLKYLLRRTLQLIIIFLIITVGIYGIIELMPGDYITMYLGENHKLTPAQVETMKESLGMGGNVVQRYLSWMGRTFTGDFGRSMVYRQDVRDIIGEFILNSFLINIVATVIAFTLAIFIGIKSAVKKGKLFDSAWTVFSLIFVSIPTFVFALLLVYIFPVKLGILPLNGMITAGARYANFWEKAKDVMYHMILPVFVLVCASLASYIRYIRSSMLEVINQDYIRTARAKGLSEKTVIYKHALRNAMIPIVTLLGNSIAGLFTGAMMLETVMMWPGMGRIMIDSINKRDTPLMLIIFTIYALMTLLGNFLADLGYGLVDPRVKLGD